MPSAEHLLHDEVALLEKQKLALELSVQVMTKNTHRPLHVYLLVYEVHSHFVIFAPSLLLVYISITSTVSVS